MKCPFCGAPANPVQDDEPSAWLETDEDFISLHGYVCIVYSDHKFYTETCSPE